MRGSVAPKDKLDYSVVPAIKLLGLREVGFAPQTEAPETGPAAQFDRAIRLGRRTFMAWTVTASIDQGQNLDIVCQGDYERMVSPGALIGNFDSFHCCRDSLDESAIRIDFGLSTK